MCADAPGATTAAASDVPHAENKTAARSAPSGAAPDEAGNAAAASEAGGDAGPSSDELKEQAAVREAGDTGAATEGSGSIPDGYICVPPPMDSEAGVSNLPTTASLVRKLREVCFCFLAPSFGFFLSISDYMCCLCYSCGPNFMTKTNKFSNPLPFGCLLMLMLLYMSLLLCHTSLCDNSYPTSDNSYPTVCSLWSPVSCGRVSQSVSQPLKLSCPKSLQEATQWVIKVSDRPFQTQLPPCSLLWSATLLSALRAPWSLHHRRLQRWTLLCHLKTWLAVHTQMLQVQSRACRQWGRWCGEAAAPMVASV